MQAPDRPVQGPPTLAPRALSPQRLALALAISVLCGAVFAVRLDWPAVGAALVGARWPLVALASTLTLVHVALRAVRWRLMLGRTAPPLGTLTWAYFVGVAAGFAVPASGELTRAVLLARRTGLRTSYVLGSVAIEKLLDTAAGLGLLAVGLWQAARLGWLGGAAGAAAVALGAGILVLAALVLRAPRAGLPAPPAGLPPRLAHLWVRLSVALAEAWVRFAGGVAAVLRLPPAYQAGIGLLTLAAWGSACLLTVIALAAFDLPADWTLAAVLYGTLLLGLAVPSAPGAVGTYEVTAVFVLQGFGLPLAASAAFAVGFHVLTFAPPLLVGAIAYVLRPPGRAATPIPGC
ncbi:MAG TPA: lysylphosphatidylglycerol synthase transmembrane domain-containing protein [Chloroflexota bacterium]